MSAALERFHNLDETLNAIKKAHNEEMQEMRATLMEAQTKAALAEGLLKDAVAARTHAERVTVKLLTQFALVEKIFSDVKRMALEVEEAEKAKEPETVADQMKAHLDKAEHG